MPKPKPHSVKDGATNRYRLCDLCLQRRYDILRIDTGMVFVNHPTWTTAGLPFGGIKNSGYGRELSSMGIQEFVNKKLVRVASIDAPD